MRPRLNVTSLPGRPDVVFPRAKVVVFCDGDFWHGRDFAERRDKLARGHNATYWLAKISGNVARDRRHNRQLRGAGWQVIRCWEGDIRKSPERVAKKIFGVVKRRLEGTR